MNREFHDELPPDLGPTNAEGRRVALVIGNGGYRHATPLRNPANDAKTMAAALEGLGFEVVGGERDGVDLDYGTMAARLRDFGRKLREGGEVATTLLFFAGHGLQVAGRNYLVPVDAALAYEADVGSELFELQYILNQMERPNRTSIVLLDACRNNPLARNLARAMCLGDARSAAIVEGLAEQTIVAGTLIAYATQPGHVAYDGDGSNGYFTEALLADMGTPGLEIRVLLSQARSRVYQRTQTKPQGPQVPWDHSSLMGAFYFRPPSGSVDESTLEHTYWQSVKDSGDAAELEAFLARFPNGTFAMLAHERGEAAIDATTGANALRSLLQRYPGSQRAQRMRRRFATLEWERLRKSRDPAALEAFASEVEGAPEAALAMQRAATLQASSGFGRGGGTRWWLGGGAAVVLALGAAFVLWLRPVPDPQPRVWPNPFATAPAGRSGSEFPDHLAKEKERIESKVKEMLAARPPPARCPGIEVDVIGAGKRCLDPSKPGEREFQDCVGVKGKQVCLPMVVLPKGDYLQGDETKLFDDINRRLVTIGYHLAIGKFEVTFAEWDACVDDDGCKHKPEAAWGRDRQPVMRVSWDDITKEYLPWLNRKLGLTGVYAYRLLTEAEWEYAARGVTSALQRHTKYSSGYTITKAQAQFSADQTVEVGKFPANEFGLHDMHGNVSEWVQDCFVDNREAPTDGMAVPGKQGCARVLRGGSWSNIPEYLRSAFRISDSTGDRYYGFGFRIARSVSR